MIKNLILRYISSNLDHLIDFLNGLDDHLDRYIQSQSQRAEEIQTEINKKNAEKAAVMKQAETAVALRSGVKTVVAK